MLRFTAVTIVLLDWCLTSGPPALRKLLSVLVLPPALLYFMLSHPNTSIIKTIFYQL